MNELRMMVLMQQASLCYDYFSNNITFNYLFKPIAKWAPNADGSNFGFLIQIDNDLIDINGCTR